MKTYLKNPKILIILGSLDINTEDTMSFNDIITKGPELMKQITNKLMEFHPDFIFVEKLVNNQILQELQNKVSIVQGVKVIPIF
jgi:hypothetical protein